jgi:amidophosphoribosyltransferase
MDKFASIKLDVEPGERYISRVRSNNSQPIQDVFAQINDRINEEMALHPSMQTMYRHKKQIFPTLRVIFRPRTLWTFGKIVSKVYILLRQNNWMHRNLILAGNLMTNVKNFSEPCRIRSASKRNGRYCYSNGENRAFL